MRLLCILLISGRCLLCCASVRLICGKRFHFRLGHGLRQTTRPSVVQECVIQRDSIHEAQKLPSRTRRCGLGRGSSSVFFRFLSSESAAAILIHSMILTCNELSFAKSSSFVMLPALSCASVTPTNAITWSTHGSPAALRKPRRIGFRTTLCAIEK